MFKIILESFFSNSCFSTVITDPILWDMLKQLIEVWLVFNVISAGKKSNPISSFFIADVVDAVNDINVSFPNCRRLLLRVNKVWYGFLSEKSDKEIF